VLGGNYGYGDMDRQLDGSPYPTLRQQGLIEAASTVRPATLRVRQRRRLSFGSRTLQRFYAVPKRCGCSRTCAPPSRPRPEFSGRGRELQPWLLVTGKDAPNRFFAGNCGENPQLRKAQVIDFVHALRFRSRFVADGLATAPPSLIQTLKAWRCPRALSAREGQH
jgi:hypothetical protein